jgi:hypothetical protein
MLCSATASGALTEIPAAGLSEKQWRVPPLSSTTEIRYCNIRRTALKNGGDTTSDTRAYGTSIAQTTSYTLDSTSNMVTATTDALSRETTTCTIRKGT